MGESLRGNWPSNRINPWRALSAATQTIISPSDAPVLPCPACGTGGVAFRRDGRALYGECDTPACAAAYDHFEYVAAVHGDADPVAAARRLRAAGVPVPPRCEKPAVVRSYQRHRAARHAVAALARAMAARRVDRHAAGPFPALGVDQAPHRPPDWWCLPGEELAAVLGGGRAVGRSVVMAVPCYDDYGRVGRVYHTADGAAWGWRDVYGADPGVGFLSGAAADLPAWGGAGVVVTRPDDAVVLAAACRRAGGRAAAPLVFAPCEAVDDPAARTREVAAALPRRPWVVWAAFGAGGRPARAFDVLLARRLGAGVVVASPPVAEMARGWPQSAAPFMANAVHWAHAFEAAVGACTPFGLGGLLSQVGWGGALAAEVRPHWRPATLETAARVWGRRRLGDGPAVRLRPGLTVVDADPGWLWEEQAGTLLAAAVPVVLRAYRGGDRRTRYAGVVRWGGRTHPFDADAARFRRDPVAVVEAACLRDGRDCPPPPHPVVVPHMAHLARYLPHLNGRSDVYR